MVIWPLCLLFQDILPYVISPCIAVNEYHCVTCGNPIPANALHYMYMYSYDWNSNMTSRLYKEPQIIINAKYVWNYSKVLDMNFFRMCSWCIVHLVHDMGWWNFSVTVPFWFLVLPPGWNTIWGSFGLRTGNYWIFVMGYLRIPFIIFV